MATLERIRSKGIFLLIVIGLAMLAFIIGDFLNNSSSFFNQNRTYVGEIDGTPVKYEEFQSNIDEMTDFYKVEYGTNTLDERTNESIRESAWQNILSTRLTECETEKLGLVVNDNELNDALVGERPDPSIMQLRVFANPETGRFDRNQLISIINQLNNEPSDPSQYEQYQLLNNYWNYCKRFVKNSRLIQKYNVLLQKGINTTTLEAKLAYDSKKNINDVIYVEKTFASVANDKIEISDKEMSARYEAEKERYKLREESRDIKLVAIENKPSEEDFQSAEKWINGLKEEFSTINKNEIATFVNTNSNTYVDEAVPESEIAPELRSFAFSGSAGQVMGPQLFGNTYKMARIVENHILQPDSITIQYLGVQQNTKEATEKTADSIIAVVNNGTAFASINGSQEQTLLTYNNSQNKDLIEQCLANPVGKIFKFEPGNGAIFIVQVNKKAQAKPMVKLAVINSEVRPSKTTTSNNYNAAKTFAASTRESENFDEFAVKNGYGVQPLTGINANAPRLMNLDNSRDIVKWAFNEENQEGDVSDVFECGDIFVIAQINSINKKGYLTLDNEMVSANVRNLILNDKKAEIIAKEMSGSQSVTELAERLNLKVDSATAVNFASSTFGSAGYEPRVVASASLAKKGAVSVPVKGENGVFVYQVVEQKETEAPFVAETEKQTITTQSLYGVYNSLEAVMNEIEVTDNRSNFF